MVEAGEYDRFVVLMSDISGDRKTTFYVGATIRSLSYAPVQELGRGFAWYLLGTGVDVVGERVAARFPFLVMLTSA